jgi:hypothetical protein
MSDVQNPPPDFSGSGAVEYRPASARSSSALEALLAREEARLLAILGVTSVGIGLGPAGTEVLVVGVVDAGVATRLPSDIEGVPVVVNVSGPVDALRRR